MQPIKMLALDLDGTLAVNGHDVLPATRDALEAMHTEGVEVVIATGRRYRTTRFVISNLGFEVFAVCNGGALVKSPVMDTISEVVFTAEQVAALVDIARRRNLAMIGQRDAHGRGGADFVIDDSVEWGPLINRYFRDNKQWSHRGDLAAQSPEFLVFGMMGEEAALHDFVAEVHADHHGVFGSVVVPHVGTNGHYAEITQSHVHKWFGLNALCTEFGISAENLCVAGDQLNDVPMMEAAGHSFAMANGNPDLHRVAKNVCGAHDEDGLLEIVDYIRTHNTAC